jgi:plasmid stabilization system protein ParE
VATVRYARRLAEDVARIAEHLAAHEVGGIVDRLDEVFEALRILEGHPLIGRKAGPARRELVIGRGSRGYVALYRYDEVDDVVEVLAPRGQKEAGFDEG